MTNYITLLDQTARQLKAIIESTADVETVPTDDYGWENHRWRSPHFRMAHLEIFNQDRFMVVHLCVFPHAYDPRPIFGFDVIAGESKVTGVFMDLSPTIDNTEPFTSLNFGKMRERPEWGDIFSQHWIACRPNAEEMITIAEEVQRVLRTYLDDLSLSKRYHPKYEEVINAQNHYCLQQRKNEHTVKAIKNLLGEQRATEFVTQVLFPTI